MKRTTFTRRSLAVTAGIIGILIGCNTVVDQINDQATTGTSTGGTGFAEIDSDFSDAPVSPGRRPLPLCHRARPSAWLGWLSAGPWTP